MSSWNVFHPSFSRQQVFEGEGAAANSSEMDIILGRGTLHTKNPGNKSFYKIVDGFIPLYNAAKTKSDKSDILHQIYLAVLASGRRFVKQNEAPRKTCHVVDEKEAKEKIGHTMRYRQKVQVKKTSGSVFSEAISRSSSLQSLVTEGESGVAKTRPLPPPPKLAKYVSPQRSIFSDQELSSVLGTPGEIELTDDSWDHQKDQSVDLALHDFLFL